MLLAAVTAVYLVEWRVALAAVDRPDVDLLAWAVAVDLVVLVPLLVYLVTVRGLGWRWVVTVPAVILGMLTAGALIPAAKDGVLADLELLAVPLELALLLFVAWHARAGWRRLRSERAEGGGDVAEALQRAAAEVIGPGRLAEIAAYELTVMAFAFGHWRRPLPEPSATRFTVDRRSGIGLLAGGLLVATAAEIVPIHLLLHHFAHPAAAWAVTALSFYGGVWLLAHWQAARHRPIELGPGALLLRVGLLWRVTVPYRDVAELRPVPVSQTDFERALRAYPAGRPTHILELIRPVTAEGLYGLRKTVDRIAFHVDDAGRFETALAERCPGETGAA